MARAALDWTTRDLAAKAGVGVNTVTRFERGDDTRRATVTAIRITLEAAGVEFIPENGGGPGVRLKAPLALGDAGQAKDEVGPDDAAGA